MIDVTQARNMTYTALCQESDMEKLLTLVNKTIKEECKKGSFKAYIFIKGFSVDAVRYVTNMLNHKGFRAETDRSSKHIKNIEYFKDICTEGVIRVYWD